jgi:uncharacterized protein YdhG (YjbR/CyaY superfamily)
MMHLVSTLSFFHLLLTTILLSDSRRKKMNKIDLYISKHAPAVRDRLEHLRQFIKEILPNAEEVMSYGVPAFRLKKVVLMYAAHKEHIGFYPMPETIVAFKDKLKDFSYAEGTVRFPHNKELPMELIREMVEFRLNALNKEH